MTPKDAPLVDLTSQEFTSNPYPFYARLRNSAPVYRQPKGSWLVTRHQDCVKVIEDNRFVNVQEDRCYPDDHDETSTSQPSDSPYSRMRKAVSRALAPSLMRTFEVNVRRKTDELVDAALDAGDIDVVEDLGGPLGTEVFCDVFGVPPGDRGIFRQWVDDMVHGVDLLIIDSAELEARSRAARLEFFAYVWRLIGERRRKPAADLLSDIVAIQQDDKSLTDLDLIAFCISLFIAGHASTSRFIPFATYALLKSPDELQRFRENPEIESTAVEELMRHSTPMQFLTRAARTDVELDGRTIRKGDVVACVIGSANRDPEVFADPDRLDLARSPNRHIAFGHGRHFCLGGQLARLEARIMLSILIRRAPALRLRAEPAYQPWVWLRGLADLPVSLR